MPGSATYRHVEGTKGEFAQLMALFAAWRADIDAEPFAYTDADLLDAWRRPECVRLDHRARLRFAPFPRPRDGDRP